MKKASKAILFLSIFITSIILLVTFFSSIKHQTDTESAALFAYLDINLAYPAKREQIAEARRIIAYTNFNAEASSELQEMIRSDQKLFDAVFYAYLDVEAASDDLRNQIYKARYIIISNTSWFDNRIVDTVREYDPETGIHHDIKPFSELFPSWGDPSYYIRLGFDLG